MTQGYSTQPPTRAIVLSAGLGKRMRPLTAITPKPLIQVNGKPLIDHGLDRLAGAGIRTTVVNVHYLADLVQAHVSKREVPECLISDERDLLLETGGGIAKALPLLGEHPFFTMNSDSFWIEGVRPNLDRASAAWDDGLMDGLLLLAPITASIGYSGTGDFLLDGGGRIARRREGDVAPFVYSGTALIHPRLFTDAPDEPFSINILFDRAIESGRLYGLRLDGLWLHIGTPEAIGEAEAAIAASVA
jgi:MurNAc alpha-1-phosphate uridylyltransferase